LEARGGCVSVESGVATFANATISDCVVRSDFDRASGGAFFVHVDSLPQDGRIGHVAILGSTIANVRVITEEREMVAFGLAIPAKAHGAGVVCDDGNVTIRATRIINVTVRMALKSSGDAHGGVMAIFGGRVKVEDVGVTNVDMQGSRGRVLGGGISVEGGQVTIDRTELSDIHMSSRSGVGGAGVFVGGGDPASSFTHVTSMVISNCSLSGAEAKGGGFSLKGGQSA
jgi:hypothetical protein